VAGGGGGRVVVVVVVINPLVIYVGPSFLGEWFL